MHHSWGEVEENFTGSEVVEDFSWDVIDGLLDGIDLLVSDFREVSASGKVSSNESVHVLNPTFLPRGIRVAEVGLDPVVMSKCLMECPFTTVVKSDTFYEFLWHGGDCFSQRIQCVLRRSRGKAMNLYESRLPFCLHRQSLFDAFVVDNRVRFPMSQRYALVNGLVSLVNTHSVRNVAFLSSFPCSSSSALLLLRRKVLPVSVCMTLSLIQPLVDALGGDGHAI